ncbi:hypothetical protein D3C86_1645740 [compost metagenome]
MGAFDGRSDLRLADAGLLEVLARPRGQHPQEHELGAHLGAPAPGGPGARGPQGDARLVRKIDRDLLR